MFHYCFLWRTGLLGLALLLNNVDDASARRLNQEGNSFSHLKHDVKKKENVIDLEVAGRIKCLICGPVSQESSIIPLFPSNTGKQPFLYGTAHYRFQKERWYGLTRLGTIFRWQIASHRPRMPRIVDLVSERGLEPGSHSLLDSTCIRLDWDESDSSSLVRKPSLEVRFDYSDRVARFGWFLPICQRLHLYSTSHFVWNRKIAASSSTHLHHIPSKYEANENVEWWIPTLKLDPFGLVTSENDYKTLYNDRYLMRLRLRISKSISFLSAWDEEHDTRVRLECSMMDKEQDNSISTARLEALVERSNLLRSIGSTRVVLIHEHSLSKA